MGKRYSVQLLHVFTSILGDVERGTVAAAPMVRDLLDAALKFEGTAEDRSDAILQAVPVVYPIIIRSLAAAAVRATIEAERAG